MILRRMGGELSKVNVRASYFSYNLVLTLVVLFDRQSEDRGDGQPGACAMGDTVDGRSLKDGYAAEAIVAGEACGKHYMVTVRIA